MTLAQSLADALAILNLCNAVELRAELEQLQPGQPRGQAFDTDRTTSGQGPSDPTYNAATTPNTAAADLATYNAAIRRITRNASGILADSRLIAHLTDKYLPTHEPRRGTIARDTRGCVWHDQAGVEEHKAAAHRTDFGTVLKQPLSEPVDVCQSCFDFVRTYKVGAEPTSARPTNEELKRHHRTGKWTARTTGAFSVKSIAATRPTTEVA